MVIVPWRTRILTDLKENGTVSGTRALACQLHSATDDSQTTIERDKRTSNTLLVTQGCEKEGNDENDGIRRYSAKLSDCRAVAKSTNDCRKAFSDKQKISAPLYEEGMEKNCDSHK